MRSGRSLLVLAVLFGGLLAYLFFVDAKKPVTPEGTEPKDKVFTVEADKIDALRIVSSGGERTTLSKEKGTWRMTEPIAAAADESEASSITSSLSSLEMQSVVDETPKDLAPYGLAEPRAEVAFKTAGAKDFKRLLIGAKTPTGGDLYAKLADEKRVFLIPAYLDTSFDRKPFDLRDKSILRFERDKVDRVEIAHGSTKIEIVKAGTDWMITSPVKARADFSAVEGLITRLQSAQMKSVVAESVDKMAEYGLEKPAAVATLGTGSSRATLAFGRSTAEKDVYARDISRQVVATVGNDLLDDVKKEVTDLRRKDVFESRPFNMTRVEITRGADTFTYEKTRQKDNTDKWRRVAPNPGDVDAAKMDTLLSRLTGLRAQSFADSSARTGLGSPALTVSVRFDDGKRTEQVRFGRSGSDVFAGQEDEPGAARVETAQFDEAVAALDAVK